jgi:predicted RNase H-like HicB family nuclease
MEVVKYVALIEQADDGGFGGYVPDLPGLGVVGYETVREAVESLRVALAMHLEGMREDGEVPPPPSQVELLEAC